MRVPQMYAARFDDTDRTFVQLLEDLDSTGCTVSDGTYGVARDAAAGALDDLADLHPRFESPADRRDVAGWVPEIRRGSRYGADLLQVGLDRHRDRLSDDFATISELYIDDMDALQALWHEGPTTVLHGDPHIGNLFDDRGRTGFLDWGLINVGTPTARRQLLPDHGADDRRPAAVRTRTAPALSRRSPCARRERDRLRRRMVHAPHPGRVPRAGVLPGRDVPGRASASSAAIFAEAFFARAEAALADLDAVDALRRWGSTGAAIERQFGRSLRGGVPAPWPFAP